MTEKPKLITVAEALAGKAKNDAAQRQPLAIKAEPMRARDPARLHFLAQAG